jgi:hypothetical protein
MTGDLNPKPQRRRFSYFLKTIVPIVFCLPWIVGASGGCPNVYQSFAQTTSDPALLFQAQQLINSGNYTGAITTIGNMTSAGQATHDATVLLSTAYVGRCGLDMLGLATSIANMGTTTLFNTLETVFSGATASTKSDCDTADVLMTGLPASELSPDDDVFLAFVELAKIGTTLVTSGATTAAYTCSTMASADVRQVGSGLTIAYNSLVASGAVIAAPIITAMKALCTVIASPPASDATFCTTTNPASFTSNELDVIETLIGANEIGVNSCGGASYTGSCHCP